MKQLGLNLSPSGYQNKIVPLFYRLDNLSINIRFLDCI